ncbi:LytR/AlgR family response regulator transcription factor [Aliikangiella coralliicola]|uniref:Response regulator transcription factor n=1 Tax=Aliikangiella coralliicola TaxID=2592383 RepID=A0A545UFX6_9GAMM|nr:response regulator transcription factor [Aliikangiella coralliicola]TQV88345.1 response regulator transcription factor [Aliikangiella coralliicola]
MSKQSVSTIIVDDESLSRKLLRKLLSSDANVDLVGEYCDGETALNAILKQKPDLVLIDIQMPIMTGIETVRRLLPMERMPYVIFITAFDEHAIKAFELGAIDYLVKPINKDRFLKAMERAKSAIIQEQFYHLGQKMLELSDNLNAVRQPSSSVTKNKVVKVFKGEQLKQLEIKDIVWIEALNQYLKIHTMKNTYILSENLAQFSKKLNCEKFLRVHRSSIINLEHLRLVNKKGYGAYSLTLSNNVEVKLARSRTDLLECLLANAKE